MKKSKIKLVLVASLVAMTTIPALLNLSSCSNDKPAPIPGPTPPKQNLHQVLKLNFTLNQILIILVKILILAN